MNAVINVCIIIITIAIVSLIIMLISVMKDVRRVRLKSEKLLDTIEDAINPIFFEIKQATENIRKITYTTRCQIEKVDSTADHITENLNKIVEKWIITVNVLNDALTEPIGDIVSLLKGVSKGVRFFFNNNREEKNSS